MTLFKDSSKDTHLSYLYLHCFAFFFPSTCKVSCPRLTYAFSHSQKHESIAREACKGAHISEIFYFPSFIELVSSRFASLLATEGPFTPRRWLITDHCWESENAKIAMKNKKRGKGRRCLSGYSSMYQDIERHKSGTKLFNAASGVRERKFIPRGFP